MVMLTPRCLHCSLPTFWRTLYDNFPRVFKVLSWILIVLWDKNPDYNFLHVMFALRPQHSCWKNRFYGEKELEYTLVFIRLLERYWGRPPFLVNHSSCFHQVCDSFIAYFHLKNIFVVLPNLFEKGKHTFFLFREEGGMLGGFCNISNLAGPSLFKKNLGSGSPDSF